ncbi:MAG: inositol monophosphatase [Salinirussus sp.]
MEDTDGRPTETEIDQYASVAREAVLAAADYLDDRFRSNDLDADWRAGDVKTAADHGAERRVLDRIRASYPDHAIAAEESGEHAGRGPGTYRWVVDALDGTNNYAAGVPTFGVAVTLTDEHGPLVSCVGVPVLDDVYLARRNGGVTYNGHPIGSGVEGPGGIGDGDSVPPSHATVAVVLGAPVLERDSLFAAYERLVDDLEGVCKRVVRTWAPVVYWGLLVRGRIGGFVAFHPDEREQAAGSLLAREAGRPEAGEGPLTVFGRDERTRDALLAAADGP